MLMCSPSVRSINIDFTFLVLLGRESSYKGRGVEPGVGGGVGSNLQNDYL